MKLLLFALALLFVTPAHAQDQANVVASCGSVTLTAGTSSFRTIDLTGQTCNSGGAGGGGVVGSTWSAADALANGAVLSNGGLMVASTKNDGTYVTIRGTSGHATGKLYVEIVAVTGASGANGDAAVGIADAGFVAVNDYLGHTNYSVGNFPGGNAVSSGFTSNQALGSTFAAANDVYGIAVDFAAGKYWVALNNAWTLGGDPASGTNPTITISSPALGLTYFPGVSPHGSNAGPWTLQPTAASQKYAPPAGFVAWDSAASGCSQATAYLARATGETAHAADLTTLICGLVTDGVWAKLDALYVLAQQTATDARLNLVSASYGLPAGATFTAYHGLSAFPTGGLNTGFNPSTATGPQFTQNSGAISAWVYNIVSDTTVQIGTNTITGGSALYASAAGTTYCDLNITSGQPDATATASTTGFVSCDRTSGSNVDLYWSGVKLSSTAQGSSPLVNLNFLLGDVPGGTRTMASTLAAASAGASLGAAGNLALYTRLRTYMSSVGVP